MTQLKTRWRLLTAVLAGGVLISGAVAAVAAQGSSAVRLPPIATERLIASTLRAIADGSQGNAGNSDSRDDSSGCERSSSKD